MSARVVPVGYILTDDALRELVKTDPEWQRLNGEWERATGEAKAKARRAAKALQDEINGRVFAAVKSHELPAIALKRTEAGDWVEHQVPDNVLEEMSMSVWTGSVDGRGLNDGDRWIAEAPLCFHRIEFERWRRKPGAALSMPVQVSTMSRIIPVAYVLTDEAIEELVGADPHHRRLKAMWLAATGEAKDKAYIEVCERQNQITDRLYDAVKSHQLQPIALLRTAVGSWDEHGIPRRYRDSLGGELSLWRGSVEKMELEPADEWIRKAALCFRRSDFDTWLGSTIVVRPLGAEQLPTWWTVPEAAVWIATRDLSKVQSLDPKARASLFVASEVVPGTYEASFELLAGLREGRLLASGWPKDGKSSGVSQPIQQEFWKAPTEFSESERGVEGRRGPGDAMVGLLLESDDVMAKWESPQSLLDNEKIPLGVAVGRLMHESLTAHLLRHQEVCVTGLNATGERVEIDKDVFQTGASINRTAHSVTTADGRLHWSAVMVELRPKPEGKPAQQSGQKGSHHMGAKTAARLVHRALCGEETITGLTSRERWLVTLGFLDASEKGVTDEWQEAVNKDELFEHQCDEAWDWIKSRGLLVASAAGDGEVVDRVKFESAYVAAFPTHDSINAPPPAVAIAAPARAKVSTAGQPTGGKTIGKTSPLEVALEDWANKVCEAVQKAGKRIARNSFVSLAWERFGTSSGLTVDGITAAWMMARRTVGWPDAGSIRANARLGDDELRELLIEARLLGRRSDPANN